MISYLIVNEEKKLLDEGEGKNLWQHCKKVEKEKLLKNVVVRLSLYKMLIKLCAKKNKKVKVIQSDCACSSTAWRGDNSL